MSPSRALLILAVLLLGLGAAQGWELLYILGYSLLLLLALAWVWSWASVRGLYVRPRPRLLRSEVGGWLEERVDLESLTWLPRPWLELVDAGEHPEHNLSEVLALGPYERRARRLRTRFASRGEYRLGPVTLEGADPFGLFRHQRQLCEATRLVVLPATVSLPDASPLTGQLSGGPVQGERVQFTTPNVASVRDYQPGDSLNRVHWPSTARQGRLVVKEFERDPFADVWLLLDLDRLVQVGRAPQSTEEYAVTAAASLARHFLDHDLAVGLLTQDRLLPPDRGPAQLLRALELLALARSRRDQPLDQLLLAEGQRFSGRAHLVMITSSPDARWLEVLRDLRGRGVQSSAILVDGSSFGSSLPIDAVLAASIALGQPTYLLRRGTDFADALTRQLNRR